MSWIKTDYNFGLPMVLLTLSRRSAFEWELSLELPHRPEQIEEMVRDLLRRYRPEFADAVLCGIDVNVRLNCWEFMVAHSALPKTDMGEPIPVMPLIPDVIVEHDFDGPVEFKDTRVHMKLEVP